jgi:hypothetical protein
LPTKQPSALELIRRTTGRALFVAPDGACYIGRHYAIFRSADEGSTWQFVTRMPCAVHRRVAQVSRLACRLLRHEVRAINRLSDGTIIAANREWVYYGRPGEPRMRPCTIDTSAKFLAPPMSVAIGPSDRVLWGEYDSSSVRKLVRLYVSDDGGRTFEVARTFPPGDIRHIHTLSFDAAIDRYWLLAGDHEKEPGIGLLSKDLKHFDWLVKGQQQYRAAEVFDFGDRLVYGTDSEREQNCILSLDKKSGRVERIIEIEGSCIYAARFGPWYVLSTTVEPSEVNASSHATLWASRDGARWTKVFSAAKDFWHPRYFQYGSLVLPRGASDRDTIIFSGQALKGLDGRLFAARLDESGHA